MVEKSVLTRRETEIAQAYAAGQSHKDIADRLCIAPSTVRTHIATVYRKLGVSTKIELLQKLSDAGEKPLAAPPDLGGGARPRMVLVLIAAAIAVIAAWQSTRATNILPATEPALAVNPSNRPSIAVMPFSVPGTDKSQRIFARAIASDIITDLSQFSSLFVYAADTSFGYANDDMSGGDIGRTLRVRYVLFGDMQWRDTEVRANVQVYETATSQIVWAERFARPADQLLLLQRDIVQRVAAQIGPVETATGGLRSAELARIARSPTEDLQAYDYFLRGWLKYETFTDAANTDAREDFLAATRIDPAFGKAYAMAAWTHLQDVRNARGDQDAALSQAEILARQAMQADPQEPYAHWAAGSVHLFKRRHEASVAAYETAVALNQNSAQMSVFLGWALTLAGDPERGLRYIERAISRNPDHPGRYLRDHAFAYFVMRDYDNAARILEHRAPATTDTHELLALIYAMQGREDLARAAVAQVMTAAPQTSVERAARIEPFANRADLDHYLAAMRRAGFPETSARDISQ